jgi:hypothetical protein
MVLCEDRADSVSAGDGDSGAPVHFPSNIYGDPPYAIGILSSSGGGGPTDPNDGGRWHCTSACYIYFTEFYAAQTHLSRYFSP